jgi:hypothetical protein
MAERLQGVGVLTLLAATQTAAFSAPFALVVAAFGEWQQVRPWIFYALGGLAIASAGFFAEHARETEAVSFANDYALRAYLAAGFIAGAAYGRVAGRRAGGRAAEQTHRLPS